jgi:hypothetical protein
MNEASLKRLMKLARKTGDVLIVTDPDGQEPIVLMNIDRYETLREDEIDRHEAEDWDRSEPIMDWAREMEALRGDFSVGSASEFESALEDSIETDPDQEFEERIGPAVAEPIVTPIVEEPEEPKKPQKSAENGEEKFYLESID